MKYFKVVDMNINDLTSVIAITLFTIAVLLLLLLNKMSTVSSKVTQYREGKIPLSVSFYSPSLLSSISPSFAVIHNLIEPKLYLSSHEIFIKVVFERIFKKKEIQKIEILLKNRNTIDLKSKTIRFYIKNQGVYTCKIDTEQISMKKTIEKFEQFGYDLIIK